MITEFISTGFLMLLAVMLPGPDFAMVTKNTIFHSRRAGFFTTFGIGCANLIHMSYCVLGVGVLISQSIIVFSAIKYFGAGYLIYLGIQSLRKKVVSRAIPHATTVDRKKAISNGAAFWQGFLCNLLNPKATLFFLALFTMILNTQTSYLVISSYVLEMLMIAMLWFTCLTLFLSHPRVMNCLVKLEKYLEKMLGFFLIGFGFALAFTHK